jgi:hypothetical protein
VVEYYGFLEHDAASLGELFLTFLGNIVPCDLSVEQFMKNGIPIRPCDTWKEKHYVISEHQEQLAHHPRKPEFCNSFVSYCACSFALQSVLNLETCMQSSQMNYSLLRGRE